MSLKVSSSDRMNHENLTIDCPPSPWRNQAAPLHGGPMTLAIWWSHEAGESQLLGYVSVLTDGRETSSPSVALQATWYL